MRNGTFADALDVSAARHAYDPAEVAVAERPRRSPVPTAFLGLALSAAAVWFVLLPAINEKPPAAQSCVPAVLSNGTIGCASAAPLTSDVSTP